MLCTKHFPININNFPMNSFKLIFGFFFFSCFNPNIWSQVVYYVDNQETIYSYDLSTCQTTLIANVTGIPPQSIGDLTFAPDNEIYIVSLGNLYVVDITTGQATLLGYFGSQFISSLVSDALGNIFAAGYSLYSYNIYSNVFQFHGDFPPNIVSAGDLTFRNDTLFMAAYLQGIVQIDISNPENSSFYFNYTTNDDIYGITTIFISCDSII